METLKDLQTASAKAQWSACVSLRHAAMGDGPKTDAIAKAMFHAGEAWAYFRAMDVFRSVEAKRAAKKAK